MMAVKLKLVSGLVDPWPDRFRSRVLAVADRLANRLLAAQVAAYVPTLTLTRYTTEATVDMSAMFFPNETEVIFLDSAFDGIGGRFPDEVETSFSWVAMHEGAHVVDHVSGYRLSAEFAAKVGSSFQETGTTRRYLPGNRDGLQYPTTISGSKSIFEDFAESVAMYLTGEEYMRARFGRVDQARLSACAELFTANGATQ